MIDISKSFTNSSETVSDFFQRPGIGFYIPLYQREYSWDTENIDQLMEDISRGVEALLNEDKTTIRFLGTIILVQEIDKEKNIKPQDKRALPTRIDNVIDGQQRISTIALLACLLYQKLEEYKKKLPEEITGLGIEEAINTYLATLSEIFSFDLRRGEPQRKPIIIRGSVDGWTFNGDDDTNYKSDVALFLATFIRAIDQKFDFPRLPKGSLVGKNLKKINDLLKNVEKAHESKSSDFPPAWQILEKMSEVDVWSYDRPELRSIVTNRTDPMSTEQNLVCSLVQLFAFSYYLLQRCCFTVIEPVSEDWAFDMFQSLNATGTPLTAIETFKPLVVNIIGEFKGSKSENYFKKVDELLSQLRSAASKNKLTNDYLTLFGTTYEGEKNPSRQFSKQRKWLIEKYDECTSLEEKEEFIRRMADVATYWEEIIKPKQIIDLPRREKVAEAERKLATLCVIYLKDAGHKMAHSILSRFYAMAIREKDNGEQKFVFACKAVAAFFTLWRAALPNTGLDDVYRKLLRDQMSWEQGDDKLSVESLNLYLLEVLTQKGIGTQDEWKNKATQYLRYDNVKTVCKFALFVTAHDTIPDQQNPGLMKKGRSNSFPLLDAAQWVSTDFKTIEHVAPQKPSEATNWDKHLYESNNWHRIGNLILLSTEINSSAGNKGWIEKWIYYRHLAEKDPDKLASLDEEAKNNGVNLNPATLELLKETSYTDHVMSLVTLGATGQWDKSLVDRRTERICDILWERMHEWLVQAESPPKVTKKRVTKERE